eukprot:2403446-Pleurochrysis_carterae.AAC.2
MRTHARITIKHCRRAHQSKREPACTPKVSGTGKEFERLALAYTAGCNACQSVQGNNIEKPWLVLGIMQMQWGDRTLVVMANGRGARCLSLFSSAPAKCASKARPVLPLLASIANKGSESSGTALSRRAEPYCLDGRCSGRASPGYAFGDTNRLSR